MPAITITDLTNAKLDVDHIKDIATSTSATCVDRLGHTKPTIQGATDSLAADVAAVDAAKVTAITVSIPAAVALVDEEVALTAAGSATAAKVAAESARDAALIQAGVYTTEALGRAAVADGVAFKVQGSGDVAAYEYRRTNSTTSVLIATYPSISGVSTKIGQQTDLIRADRTHSFGPSTPATGTNAGQATYIIAGRPLPTGLLDTIKIYAGGTGAVKVKRFTRTADTFTFVDEFTLSVVAGLNTFQWADGTLAYKAVSDGDYLGFYPSSGTIMKYNAVSAPCGTEYHSDASDVTTTLAVALGAVPADTIRLEVYASVRLADGSTDAMVGAEKSDWGGTMYLGARTPALPTAPQFMSMGLTYYEDHEFKETSRLKTITVYASLATVLKVFVLSPSGAGQFTRRRAFTVELAAGSNTKTAGVDFPADVIIPKGGLIGHRALKASAIPMTVFIQRRYRSASVEPSATVTAFDQGDTSAGTHQIRYDVETQQTVRKVVDRTQYLVDDDFTGAAITLQFSSVNWTQGTGVVTSAGIGLANFLDWREGTYFSKTKHRVKFTFDAAASSILVYRKPNANGSLGTIFEVDMTGNSLRVYAAWTGGTTLPAVSQSRASTLTFATGNAYWLEMEKSYMTLTLTITDAVTGASDSITIDAHANLAAGALLGIPGVAAKAGIVSVDRFSYLSSVKDPKVVLFGDSITQGSGATLVADAWAYLVAEAAGGLTSAHSGEGASNTLRRVERELRLHQPKYAVVMIGTNDTNMTTWQDSIGFIAEKCLNAGTIPFFCTLPPEAADTNPVLVQNPFIRSSGYRYIDMARALTVGGDGTTRDESKFADALHPNTAGHLAMYNRVRLDVPELFD